MFKILCVALFVKLPKYSSVTAAHKSLHWLPISQRIDFKGYLLALHTGLPPYFSSQLKKLTHTGLVTRNGDPRRLKLETMAYIPKIHTSWKQLDYSFTYSAPDKWNKLPDSIRTAPTVSTFHKLLKTHLFDCAYPP